MITDGSVTRPGRRRVGATPWNGRVARRLGRTRSPQLLVEHGATQDLRTRLRSRPARRAGGPSWPRRRRGRGAGRQADARWGAGVRACCRPPSRARGSRRGGDCRQAPPLCADSRTCECDGNRLREVAGAHATVRAFGPEAARAPVCSPADDRGPVQVVARRRLERETRIRDLIAMQRSSREPADELRAFVFRGVEPALGRRRANHETAVVWLRTARGAPVALDSEAVSPLARRAPPTARPAH